MQKKILKCKVPILWIDTSVIIKMALWRLSHSLSKIDRTRVAELYEMIRKLVAEKKIICSSGGQEEEIWVGEKTCKDIILSLSLGIHFKHRQEIEDLLIARFMKAFINKEEEMVFSYSDAFHKDPIKEIEGKDHFIVYADMGRFGTIEELKKRIEKICSSFESIRQEAQRNRETFEERLEKEYRGYMEGHLHLGMIPWAKARKGEFPTFEEIMGSITLGIHLTHWEDYGGKPPGLVGLIRFYLSDIFKEIPSIQISCKLLSKIITSSVRIESGDSMDNQLISAYLPYCDIMVTDRKMKNRIKELNLDKEYGTAVFALSDYDELRGFLLKI